MFCFHYFIFFCFFTYEILQLNAFDEEHNDIFAELWQKSEEIGTKSGKCEETLQASNKNFQKIGKIKKEIVVKDEPNDNDEFDPFLNERQQKIALNKIVKEENVEKRVKSEYMEFDRISDKEEFDNWKDGEEQSTDSNNLNLKESSSKSQKEIAKQEKIAEFDELKKEFKTRTKGMSYNMKKVEKKIARKLGVSRTTIYIWKKKFGVTKTQKKYTEAEKVELLKNFHKMKKENPQLRKDKIAQMLNINISTFSRWKSKPKSSKAGIKKNYLEDEKQQIIAEFDELKKNSKLEPKECLIICKNSMKKLRKNWELLLEQFIIGKSNLEIPKKQKKRTDAEKLKLLENFIKTKNKILNSVMTKLRKC